MIRILAGDVRSWWAQRCARRLVPWSACVWNPHDFARQRRGDIIRESLMTQARLMFDMQRQQLLEQVARQRNEWLRARLDAVRLRDQVDQQRKIFEGRK